MITVLDAQPQEWMTGDANNFHTVAACCFESIEHAEYWINMIVPKNQNGKPVKWSECRGRQKSKNRSLFIENCMKFRDSIDFKTFCISSQEGDMSWFAQTLYMQNTSLIQQKNDFKDRNNLVFHIGKDNHISFPVLRAAYLIWYHHVVLTLENIWSIKGTLLSDYFANDEMGPGEGKAQGVAFVNFLLSQAKSPLVLSLPTNDRFRNLDRLSDYFCGWINFTRNGSAAYSKEFAIAEESMKFLEAVTLKPQFTFLDESGNDITRELTDKIINPR